MQRTLKFFVSFGSSKYKTVNSDKAVRLEKETVKHCFPEMCLWIIFTVIFLQTVCVVQLCEEHVSTDLERCCITITVKEGFQPVICNADGEEASFESCPPGTYQSIEGPSFEFHRCERLSTCQLPNLITKTNGNSTSNTICQCNEGEGYQDTRSVTDVPPKAYQCSHAEIVSQSPSVHTVNSTYPAETSSNIPISSDSRRSLLHLAFLVCGVLVVFGVLVVLVACLVIQRKKIFQACSRRRDTNIELSSMDQRSLQHNGHIERTYAAEIGVQTSMASSVVVDENAYDSTVVVNYNLQQDCDHSISPHPASLCYKFDES